jgi:hypothetical protein
MARPRKRSPESESAALRYFPVCESSRSTGHQQPIPSVTAWQSWYSRGSEPREVWVWQKDRITISALRGDQYVRGAPCLRWRLGDVTGGRVAATW